MVSEADILADVRTELGDLLEPFRDSYRGDGVRTEWDLSAQNLVASSVTAYTTNNDDPPVVTTIPSTDFMLNLRRGMIKFDTAPDRDDLIVVEGDSYGIFSDTELEVFLHAALSQHLLGRTNDRRYRDGHGFIKYDRDEMTLETMPEEEKILVSLLTSIEALWALSTDASMDIDVQTAEGTSIPRGQRWRQLQGQIELLESKYTKLSLAMGVGLYAPEVFKVRRVSRTTGRYVPIFQDREYDEHGPPIRKNIRVSTKGSDPDGPASPWWSGGWGH